MKEDFVEADVVTALNGLFITTTFDGKLLLAMAAFKVLQGAASVPQDELVVALECVELKYISAYAEIIDKRTRNVLH